MVEDVNKAGVFNHLTDERLDQISGRTPPESLYIISSGDIENYDIDALLTGKPGSNLEALFQQFRDEVHIPAKASEEYRTWERRLYLEYGYPEDGWRFSPTWFFAQWLIKYHGFQPQKYDEFYLDITDI